MSECAYCIMLSLFLHHDYGRWIGLLMTDSRARAIEQDETSVGR